MSDNPTPWQAVRDTPTESLAHNIQVAWVLEEEGSDTLFQFVGFQPDEPSSEDLELACIHFLELAKEEYRERMAQEMEARNPYKMEKLPDAALEMLLEDGRQRAQELDPDTHDIVELSWLYMLWGAISSLEMEKLRREMEQAA